MSSATLRAIETDVSSNLGKLAMTSSGSNSRRALAMVYLRSEA